MSSIPFDEFDTHIRALMRESSTTSTEAGPSRPQIETVASRPGKVRIRDKEKASESLECHPRMTRRPASTVPHDTVQGQTQVRVGDDSERVASEQADARKMSMGSPSCDGCSLLLSPPRIRLCESIYGGDFRKAALSSIQRSLVRAPGARSLGGWTRGGLN